MTWKKTCLFSGLLLLTAVVLGQPEKEKNFKQVATLEDAHRFIGKYSSRKAFLHVLNSQYDTSARDRRLYQMKVGEMTRIGNSTYKIIEDTVIYRFRASYIYLDGSILNSTSIDSIRSVILKNYAAGVSFEDLCDKYTMDGNPNHGDTGFFETGMMVKEFEEAVYYHANGDVFKVDVPGNRWYYVAKKTADNKVIVIKITVLEMN